MSQIIWLDRDNTIDIALMDDDTPLPATGISNWEFFLFPKAGGSSITITSNATPAAFDTSESEEVGRTTVRVLKLKMGHQPIPAGEYMVRIVGYDADHVEGLVWGEFQVTVKAS